MTLPSRAVPPPLSPLDLEIRKLLDEELGDSPDDSRVKQLRKQTEEKIREWNLSYRVRHNDGSSDYTVILSKLLNNGFLIEGVASGFPLGLVEAQALLNFSTSLSLAFLEEGDHDEP